MTAQKQLPENIQQTVDLISAVLRRIMNKQLDKSRHKCLYTNKLKGAET